MTDAAQTPLARLRDRLQRMVSPPPTVSVIRLHGVIGAAGRLSRGLEDAAIAPLVERAVAPGKLAAIALAVNSPGGAPVQSVLIASRIRDAAKKRNVPVIAFCEDVAASGGYLLACAADEIYVETASIVGSIGVVSSGFGLDRAIDRLGVERRLFTAGAAKARLDPFKPLEGADVAWLRGLQDKIHEDFIARVRAARGKRLETAPPEVFSGEVFLGADAVRLGLADGIGRLRPVLEARFGPEVRIRTVTPRRGLLERFSPSIATAAASSLPEAALEALEARALWARYGL